MKVLEICEGHEQAIAPHNADQQDRARLAAWLECLKEGEQFCGNPQQVSTHNVLLTFIEELQSSPPELTDAEQFRLIFSLRGWLPLMTSSSFDYEKKDPKNLVGFVLYHATVLVAKPFFPALGSMFFRAYLTDPVQDISSYLAHMQSLDAAKDEDDRDAKLVKAAWIVEVALEVVALGGVT